MARLMSVAFTENAVRERRKTVTRRVGWRFLKPGNRLHLCRKVQGRKAGEPLVRLAYVEVVSVWREPLCAIAGHQDLGAAELEREGFPGMGVAEFVDRYFVPQGVGPMDEVTRIEWRYLDDEVPHA